MNYPLISEYIEAIKAAEDNFEDLSYLRPVLDDYGLPVMTSGNFAVVFKMKDERDRDFCHIWHSHIDIQRKFYWLMETWGKGGSATDA